MVPIYMLSRSKAPKTQEICHYRHTRKTSEIFLLFNTGVDLSLRNNFASSGSFAKVFVPVHIYNSFAQNDSLVGVICSKKIWNWSTFNYIVDNKHFLSTNMKHTHHKSDK